MKKSRIGSFFSRIAKWIYHIIAISFIGRLFTSYEACDRAMHTAYAFGGGKRSRAGKKRHYTVRRAVACAMEQNLLVRGIRLLLRKLCFTALRTLGFYFTALGALWLVLYGVEIFSALSGLATWAHLVSGLILVAVGVLLLLTDRSLGAALCSGSLIGLLLFRAFGVSDELAKSAPARGESHYLFAFLLALLTAALGILTAPLSLLAILLTLLTVLTVLTVPEAGFLLTLLVLPFSRLLVGSDFLTLLFIVLTLVGYVGKLLRGNRSFRFDWQDLPVALMAVLFFVGGFAVTGGSVWPRVLRGVLFVFFYLVSVNILATPQWLMRGRTALGISAAAAAGYGIADLFYTISVTEGVSLSLMMRYGSVMRVGFADQRAFALYLVIAFAFLLPALVHTKGWRRLFTVIATLLVGEAIILTGMTGAWLSMLAVLVVFLLVCEYRSLFAVVFGGGALTAVAFLLPTAARTAFFGIFKDVNMPIRAEGRAYVHRLLVGDGGGFLGRDSAVLRIVFGVGEGGMAAFYPYLGNLDAPFTYGAYHFWQCMLVEYGIFGIILPALFLFVLLQNSFSVLARSGAGKQLAYTGVCLTAALLVFSFFGYVFYDKAVLAAFFAAVALIGADLRNSHERFPYEGAMANDATAAHIEYRTSHKRVPQSGEAGGDK